MSKYFILQYNKRNCEHINRIVGRNKQLPDKAKFSRLPLYWRGHQNFPTVLSLKGKLPKTVQSKSAFSCEIVLIHSLFCHGFINKPESENSIRK